MTTPVVSVIIPAYNSARYIAETLESVIRQTFTDWEIVVADDCSTDDTGKIVESIALRDPRIRHYRLPTNSGRPAVPRNYAIARSNGQYIAFLDADDIWVANKLEYQLAYFEAHPEAALVFSNFILFDHNSTVLRLSKRRRNKLPNPGHYFPYLCADNPLGNSTVVVRREVMDRYGFLDEDERLCGTEDYEYWLRISRFEQFGFVDVPLVRYRVLGDSVSKRWLVMARGASLAFEKTIGRYPELCREYKADVHRGLAKWLGLTGSAEVLCGAWGAGMGKLFRSIVGNARDLETWKWLGLGMLGQGMARHMYNFGHSMKAGLFGASPASPAIEHCEVANR